MSIYTLGQVLNSTAKGFRLLLKLEVVSMSAQNPLPQHLSMGVGKCLHISPSQSLEHGHHIPERRSKDDITWWKSMLNYIPRYSLMKFTVKSHILTSIVMILSIAIYIYTHIISYLNSPWNTAWPPNIISRPLPYRRAYVALSVSIFKFIMYEYMYIYIYID